MTLNIGIVGTGWFSKVHADLLTGMEDVSLKAICGSSKQKGEDMARPYGAEGYGKMTEMLEAHKLDAVYICVPPQSHGAIERALIKRDSFLYRETAGVKHGNSGKSAAGY